MRLRGKFALVHFSTITDFQGVMIWIAWKRIFPAERWQRSHSLPYVVYAVLRSVMFIFHNIANKSKLSVFSLHVLL